MDIDFMKAFIMFWLFWSGYGALRRTQKTFKSEAQREAEDDERTDTIIENLENITEVVGAQYARGLFIALALPVMFIDVLGLVLSYGYMNYHGIELILFIIITCAILDDQRVGFCLVLAVSKLMHRTDITDVDREVQKRYIASSMRGLIPAPVASFGKLYLAAILALHVVFGVGGTPFTLIL